MATKRLQVVERIALQGNKVLLYKLPEVGQARRDPCHGCVFYDMSTVYEGLSCRHMMDCEDSIFQPATPEGLTRAVTLLLER